MSVSKIINEIKNFYEIKNGNYESRYFNLSEEGRKLFTNLIDKLNETKISMESIFKFTDDLISNLNFSNININLIAQNVNEIASAFAEKDTPLDWKTLCSWLAESENHKYYLNEVLSHELKRGSQTYAIRSENLFFLAQFNARKEIYEKVLRFIIGHSRKV